MTILGVDLSHWQGAPNFAQVKASGRDFVVLKATEGTSYVDLTCNGGYDAIRKVQVPSNRANAHAAGLVVGLYHFSRAGDAAAEALHFLRTIGTLQPGEFLVLDWEVAGTDPPAWCRAWLDAAYAATGVRGFLYTYQQQLNAYNWSPVAQGNYAFWFAKYDQSTVQPSVPYWGAPAMKQFYDKGVVPGIAGPCDVDVFYGTRDQLLAYGYQGADMPLTDADAAVIWNHILGVRNGSGPATAADWLRDGRVDAGQAVAQLTGTNVGAFSADVRGDLANKAAQLDAIQAAVGKDGDPAALAEAVVAAMGAEFAQKVIDALGQRINATQPPSA